MHTAVLTPGLDLHEPAHATLPRAFDGNDPVTVTTGNAESARLRRSHLPERASTLGVSVREADLMLRLDGAGHGLLDTTHFDTVRFPPPDWAAATFAAAAADGAAAYTAYRGGDEVRRNCAESVSNLLGIPVDPEFELAITAGAQGGLFSTLSALVDEGDVVALTDPEYLFLERMLRFLGATVVRIGMVDGPHGQQLDLAALEAAAKKGIKLLLTSNPNNPTGAVYDQVTVTGIASAARQYDFWVVVDELYCRLLFDGVPFHHIAAQPGMRERTVTLLGGSKTESLSGYRLGVVVAAAPVIDAIDQVIAMCCLRAPAYAQQLLTHWLVKDHDFVARRVGELRALRQMTVERLSALDGLRITMGAGTAYAWPDVSALGLDDVEVARVLQRDAGVVVSPGYQFGPCGHGHFRICFARDEAEWSSALDRMVAALDGARRS